MAPERAPFPHSPAPAASGAETPTIPPRTGIDVSGQALRWLSALVIVIAASGCDNVEWGGMDVSLQPPPPSGIAPLSDSAEAAADTSGFRLPAGPVLYMAERVDSLSAAQLIPVGEISGDSILPFPSESDAPGYRNAFALERMGQGREYVLFARGTRVGTMVTREVTTDESFCAPRPAAQGVVELIPQAFDARRFLAMDKDPAADFPHEPYSTEEHDRAQRAASIDLTAELIPQVGARWPTSMVESRQDMQALRIDGTPGFAATFLFRDQMDRSRAESSSWAMFVFALLQEGAYAPAYVWYREAGREGKGAARFFEQLDWDRDGDTELLLEVVGEGARWTAGVGHRDDQWQRTFQEPCGERARPVAEAGQ